MNLEVWLYVYNNDTTKKFKISFSTDLSAFCTTDTGVSGGGGTDGGGAGTKFCNPRLTGNEDTCGMTRILSFSENKY